MMRVATFANNEAMLAAALRTQARMADLQVQQASGVVSTDYGGLGRKAGDLLDFEAMLKTSQTYATAATEASGRVEMLYSTLNSVTDLLTEFRSDLVAMMSTDFNDTTGAALVSSAAGMMDELAALLNVSFEGRYLFAGDATSTVPVDLDGYVADADAASTDYFRGDSAVTTVKISSDQTIRYGITADNSAFEQAFRAIGVIAQADPLDAEQLQTAYDLLLSALDETTAVQSTLSVQASTLERAATRAEDYQSFLTAAISELKDADVTEIAVRLTSYETQLQASYSALAKVQSLNLLDYLR
jgi:flagellar hook-associated protein 3 FlgL